VKTGVIGGKRPNSASHGGGIRGDQLGTRSSLYEGRFGRMFRSLPPAQWSREALFNLGRAMTADPETAENDPTLPAAALEDPAERIHDDEENAGIAAGYTYFGQFIDHDITFDPASSLQQQNDPEALVDFRTPVSISIRSTAVARRISPTCTWAGSSGSGGRCSSWISRRMSATCRATTSNPRISRNAH